MLKSKTVAAADSNIAHLGGKEEHDARLRASEGEKAFHDAGKKEGLEIWRIENMGVNVWPKEKYGQFFDGDSYIVLKTNVDKKSGAFSWHVHFWLGKESSIDERGVAAYKTVELDDILKDAPVQHREVQGEESDLFLSYFKPAVVVLTGGVDSGFNHVKPTEYTPRLLRVNGVGKNVRVIQCDTLKATELNHGDVFILDAGLKLWQWNGSKAIPFEKHKGAEICNFLRADRPKATFKVLDDEDDAEFWATLGGSSADVQPASVGIGEAKVAEFVPKIYRLSDSTGAMTFKEVSSGKLNRAVLDPADVFFVDMGRVLYVWVGSKSSKDEKKEALVTAEKYLQSLKRPTSLPITRVLDGTVDSEFEGVFK